MTEGFSYFTTQKKSFGIKNSQKNVLNIPAHIEKNYFGKKTALEKTFQEKTSSQEESLCPQADLPLQRDFNI